MGDEKPGNGETGAAKPPTILKPGEIAPGSSQQVRLPVATPAAQGTQDKKDSEPASSPAATVPPANTPVNRAAGLSP